MKPVSTYELILAVIQLLKLAVDLFNNKEKVQDVKTTEKTYRDDHDNVINEFLGRK